MAKINPYTVTVILIVIAGVLTAIAGIIQTVDIKTLPPEIQPAWTTIVYVFTTSAAAPLFTVITNIFGFYENKYQAPANVRDNIQYEANQMVATYLRFEAYIKGITIMVMATFQGTPYANYAVYVAGSAGFIIDAVRRTLMKLAKPAPTSPAPAATPPPG